MQDSSRTRGRRRYASEFRQRVLARLDSGEASLRVIAREFGVSVPTILKWRKEEQEVSGARGAARDSRPSPHSSMSTHSSMSEVERLREEVRQLREERDRLRRGIAFLVGVKVTE